MAHGRQKNEVMCTCILQTHEGIHVHTHCVRIYIEIVTYPMSPRDIYINYIYISPDMYGAAAVRGDMYSWLLPSPNSPTHRDETVTHKSVSVSARCAA